MRPSSGSPSTCAGVVDAAVTASSIGTPSACRFLTASIIVRTLPASTPSGPRTAPSWTCRSSSPEARRPVVPRRCRDRVGHEDEPAARCAPHREHRLGCEMDTVDDDRDEDVVARERRTDDARVAVQERPHRVEEMGDAARAAVERRIAPAPRSRRCGRARRRCRARAACRSARRRRRARARASSAARARRRAAARAARGRGRGGSTPRASRAGSATGTGLRGACRGCAAGRDRRPAPRASPRAPDPRGS